MCQLGSSNGRRLIRACDEAQSPESVTIPEAKALFGEAGSDRLKGHDAEGKPGPPGAKGVIVQVEVINLLEILDVISRRALVS